MSESPVSRTWNVSSQSARRLPPARTTGRRKLVIDRAQPGWKIRGSDEARNATRPKAAARRTAAHHCQTVSPRMIVWAQGGRLRMNDSGKSVPPTVT